MSDHVVDAELVEESIVLCPICHQKNRLFRNRDKGIYQCGACRAALSNPFEKQPQPPIFTKNVLLYLGAPVLVLLVVTAILAWIFFRPLSPGEQELARKAAERDARIDRLLSEISPVATPAQPLTDESKKALAAVNPPGLHKDADSMAPELGRDESETSPPSVTDVLPTVLPTNNEILFDALPDGTFKGELTVENGSSHHAVAKLVDPKTDQKILSFAVGARQKSTIYAIPDGTYLLIFGFGDRLYEGTDRFSSPRGFSKFVRPMTFNTKSKDDAVYRDHLSVTLHPGFSGSPKTSAISQKEFERY